MQFNAIFKTLHCNQNFLTSLIKKKTKQKTLNISSSTIFKKLEVRVKKRRTGLTSKWEINSYTD